MSVELTSAGLLIFGERRSIVGFEGIVRGVRSKEVLVLDKGEGESVSDLATPRPSLLIFGVAGDVLLIGVLLIRFFVVGGVSEEEDLPISTLLVTSIFI
jgi:hypothetical protein